MGLFLKSSLIFLIACGSLSLIACGNSGQTTNTLAPPKTVTAIDGDHDHSHDDHSNENTQVIVSGIYHLEFHPEPNNDGVNLDFHLESEVGHENIPDAKVTARVQLPNGDEKMLDLPYEAEGKHYVAFLPAQTTGRYTVTILAEINGEQVSGQFAFDQ